MDEGKLMRFATSDSLINVALDELLERSVDKTPNGEKGGRRPGDARKFLLFKLNGLQTNCSILPHQVDLLNGHIIAGDWLRLLDGKTCEQYLDMGGEIDRASSDTG